MAKKRGPKPYLPGERRDSVLTVGCRTVWMEWVQRFGKRERSDPSHLVDKALAELARIGSFEEPPDR